MSDVVVPETVNLPVDDLELAAFNTNEMNTEEFEMLLENIGEVGFISPLQVVPIEDGSYRIIGGAHRWQAAKALGMAHVPCVLLSDSQWQEADLQKFVAVRMNALHGRINPEKLVALHREMAAKYGEKAMRRMFGFADKAGWQKIVKQVQKGMKDVGLPKEARDQVQKAADEATSAKDLGRVINHLFHQYGDTLEYSFMVFDFGGKEHVYIAASKRTQKVLQRVLEVCRSWGRDINEVMASVTEEWLEEAERIEQQELGAERDAL